jgi:hypothetical protein
MTHGQKKHQIYQGLTGDDDDDENANDNDWSL